MKRARRASSTSCSSPAAASRSIEDYFDKAFELEATLEAKKKDAILAEVRAAALPPGASSFTRQQAALGLGHAVLCARDIIGDEPFAVLLPDVIVKGKGGSCLKQMVDAYNEVGGNIIAVDEVPQERVNQYGVIDPVTAGDAGPAGEDEGHGREAADRQSAVAPQDHRPLHPAARKCSICSRRRRPGAGGEIQLTDAMQRLMCAAGFPRVQVCRSGL